MISKPNLFSAARATGNNQLLEKVFRWYELARRNDFNNLVELQAVFPSADMVKDKIVFNLGSHRLICGISFLRKTLFYKWLLSHTEYDRGGWKL
ncbi:MAG: type II toxin-antitoxin system HigB family toxin [Acidobacteria bacterium]|nr:type II toxin-antitoxin system HigB family toxin [Acidobacteriota bacterium]